MSDFTVLVLRGAFSSGVAATLDMLRGACALAPRLRLPQPAWRVLAPQAGLVPLGGGMHVEARALPQRTRLPDRSTWIVPGLGLETPAAIQACLALPDTARAVRALAAHAARGGHVAAACSAVFLLQAAGLLDGRRATTTWWLAAELQRLAPACRVDAARMVCADGPITTAGAAFAQTDLMLHLLRRQFGAALADALGRTLLLDGRAAQSPFIVPHMLAGGNALVARLVARIEAALPDAPSIATLAAECAMSQRTLSRHVREATGNSTMALVQQVRLNRARMLIASSRMTLERVAEQVGYEDATALRRMMRKAGGANPSQYRIASGPA